VQVTHTWVVKISTTALSTSVSRISSEKIVEKTLQETTVP